MYGLLDKAKNQEAKEIARIEADFPEAKSELDEGAENEEDDDQDPQGGVQKRELLQNKQREIERVRSMSKAQMTLLNRTISYAWIALLRSMQRMQGKGTPKLGVKIGGSRGVFVRARKRGGITSEVWIAAALLEYHNGDVEPAKKIFERGSSAFIDDERFCLEHLKFLTDVNDHTSK